ncbi:MAG: hypothetical protein RLZZ126_672 [Pseudomonadota bacterium]|jgi:serine protease Do
MHMKTALAKLCLVALLPLWAAGPSVAQTPSKVAKKVAVQAPITADLAQQPKTIVVKRFMSTANEAAVGEITRGWFCNQPSPVRFTATLATTISRPWARLFRQKIESIGYPVIGGANRSAFDTDDNRRDAEFELGLTLKNFELQACTKGTNETQGSAWLQVRWEVFSPKAQKVLLDVTTEGSYHNDQVEKIGLPELLDRAFTAAATNLLAQQAYFDLLHGKVDVPEPPKQAAIKIKLVEEPSATVESSFQQLVDSTLTLIDGNRSGSGFFVSSDGYLLTNQHVVGSQKFMKVRLSSGAEFVAELVRSNRTRDVALMKVPAAAALPALHLKLKPPATGEDAFVIGSPLGKTFAGTLTKGVISGFRQLDGVNYVQSDVRILPGSSGGPLFDAKSRVVGMTVAGLGAGTAGINLFIPIEEALKALAIELE